MLREIKNIQDLSNENSIKGKFIKNVEIIENNIKIKISDLIPQTTLGKIEPKKTVSELKIDVLVNEEYQKTKRVKPSEKVELFFEEVDNLKSIKIELKD
jgi:hypothetical protein